MITTRTSFHTNNKELSLTPTPPIVPILCREIGLDSLLIRGLTEMEISVAEAPLQQAFYSGTLPKTLTELAVIESASQRHKPKPCLASSDDA